MNVKSTNRWPSFYIVGAAKCGTTSLWAHLRKHPQVFLPKMKEPHFFSDSLVPVPSKDADLHCPGELDRYLSLYTGSEKFRAVGDASASYLWDESAARNIHKARPDARVIIMLRDPVDRAFSHYLMYRYLGLEKRPPLQALQGDYNGEDKNWWTSRVYVELGLYCAQVKRYLNTFGSDQVAVFLFDDLKRKPEELFSKIARHIGVDPELLDKSEVSRPENSYKRARFPLLHQMAKSSLSRELRHKILPQSVSTWLAYNNLLYNTDKPEQDKESKRFLQTFYAPEMNELEELLGRKLPELRQSWV